MQILVNGILVKAKRRKQKIFQAWQSGIEIKKEKGKRKMIIKVQKGQGQVEGTVQFKTSFVTTRNVPISFCETVSFSIWLMHAEEKATYSPASLLQALDL